MKLSKKVIAAMSAAALFAMAGTFVSCGDEDDDDEEGAITGSNNNYTLSYKNESTDPYRAYKTTSNKHRGALCQITLNSDSLDATCALGYIWDLSSEDASASAEEIARTVSDKPRSLCIVGFNHGMTAAGKVAYYVSRYTNVYDIQANNFGTKGDVTVNGDVQRAVEKEYIPLSSTYSFVPTKDDDGNVVVTVAVCEGGTYKDGKTRPTFDGTALGNSANATFDGSYDVYIFNGRYSSEQLDAMTDEEFNTAKVDEVNIPAADLGYGDATTSATSSVVAQKQGAVYANVYAGKTAHATWKYDETYSADEVVED